MPQGGKTADRPTERPRLVRLRVGGRPNWLRLAWDYVRTPWFSAMGLVNDHIEGCPARAQIEARRAQPVAAAPACATPG